MSRSDPSATGRPRVVAVTGAACDEATVLRLAGEGSIVIVWSAAPGPAGHLAAIVAHSGGRAATFSGPASEGSLVEVFAVEQFGGLDEVVEAADQPAAG